MDRHRSSLEQERQPLLSKGHTQDFARLREQGTSPEKMQEAIKIAEEIKAQGGAEWVATRDVIEKHYSKYTSKADNSVTDEQRKAMDELVIQQIKVVCECDVHCNRLAYKLIGDAEKTERPQSAEKLLNDIRQIKREQAKSWIDLRNRLEKEWASPETSSQNYKDSSIEPSILAEQPSNNTDILPKQIEVITQALKDQNKDRLFYGRAEIHHWAYQFTKTKTASEDIVVNLANEQLEKLKEFEKEKDSEINELVANRAGTLQSHRKNFESKSMAVRFFSVDRAVEQTMEIQGGYMRTFQQMYTYQKEEWGRLDMEMKKQRAKLSES